MFDSYGIPLVYYGSIVGYQRNPLITANYLISYGDKYTQTKNSTQLGYLKNSANWLIVNAKQYDNYSLYEYDFPYVYNLTPPWHSALSQGSAIDALTKAYQITQNETYLNATLPLLNSFYLDINNGGITEKTKNQGWWYEEYPEKNGINPRVLNGMMYVLVDMYDYYNYTHSSEAKYLFDQGVLALRNNIGVYDADGNSYYDSLRTTLASPFYMKVHIDLLDKLYKITGEPIFKKYHDKWMLYVNPQ
jgi:hypothetical protein